MQHKQTQISNTKLSNIHVKLRKKKYKKKLQCGHSNRECREWLRLLDFFSLCIINKLKKVYHSLRTLHLFSDSMLLKKVGFIVFKGVSDWTAFEKKKRRRKALTVHGSSVRTVNKN